MQRIPFVDLVAQYRTIESEVRAALDEVLARQHFILGTSVDEFERAFAEFVGVGHAVGVGNGLDALRLALQALDIGADDEVILPANTYIATALAVSALGARPVLVDCDARTYNIDPGLIEAAITPRTRAIIPVHLAGQAADMSPILEVAGRHGLHVIEDAAQAQGTRYKGRACGSLGHAGCFSFYPGKNLGAFGDAGAVTTDDAALAARLRRLRNYGQIEKYVHVEQGINSRLDSVQAAVLGVKLRYLARWNAARAAHAEYYAELLTGVGDLVIRQPAPDSTHIYHLFIVETAQRDALRRHLTAAGIDTNIHYPIPIHLQQAYSGLGYRAGDFPVAERLAHDTLSLPMYPELTRGQIQRIAYELRSFFDTRETRRPPDRAHLPRQSVNITEK
jgi:dTDP-4-amino-4,6-dideoxygalactose transaminase